jgi:transposase
MTNANTEFKSESGLTVGIDLGDKFSRVCILDADGVVEEASVRTTAEAFTRRLGQMEPSLVVIEVGGHSRWLSQLAEALGHSCLVANAYEASKLYGNRKNDRLDALTLARQARVDPTRLHPIQHRSDEVFADLAIIHSRAALVDARTMLINRVRGVVKAKGTRLPKCDTRNFPDRVAPVLPEALVPALQPLLELISQVNSQITVFDRQIERLIEERYPQAERLRQIKGVGPLISLTYVLTLEDPHRFKRSRSVGPYLGLTPKQHQSGDKDPELGISKAGDAYLRKLLLEGAHYVVGPFGEDCDLRRWGLARAGGKNARKRTLVAVARKLAVLLHHLWVSSEDYKPLRSAAKEEPKEEVVVAA